MVRQGATVVLVGTHIDCADPPDVALQVYLTQCIYRMVLESQLPHKIVKFLCRLVTVNNKLTSLWGSGLSTTI